MVNPTIITVVICPSDITPGIKYKDKAVPIMPEMILDKKALIRHNDNRKENKVNTLLI